MNWRYVLTSFDGRIGRQTFWIASLATAVVDLILMTVVGMLLGAWPSHVVDLVFYYPQLAISVKRGHDRNMPAWVVAVFLVLAIVFNVAQWLGWITNPTDQNTYSSENIFSFVVTLVLGAIGIALLIELGFRKGTPGPNRYGPDPLAAIESAEKNSIASQR